MKKHNGIVIILLLLSASLFWLDFSAGDINMKDEVFTAFRFPRVMAAALTGIGLSVSGLAMQTLFRNPLAGPFLTGATPGASFAVAIFLMAFPAGFAAGWMQSAGIAAIGMAGSMAVLLLQILIQRRHGNAFTLLISGVLLGYLLGAGTEILQGLAQAEQVKSFIMWGLGGFDRVQQKEIPLIGSIVAVSTAALWFLRFKLDTYLPGDTYATSAGMDISKFRIIVVILVGLTAGAITGFCGPIGFVGMIAPHIARGLMKSNNHGTLWLPTLLCGMTLCMLADWVAHHALNDIILPTNAVCAIMGAPAVLWIILRKK
ncbi:MAG: FecCD family ABC transporter permease [Sphingomonadales bacterium]